MTTRYITLILGCNDERGNPTGRAETIDIHTEDGDRIALVGGQVSIGLETPKDRSLFPYRVKIGRVDVPAVAYREWVGNWCCDAVTLRKSDAIRVLNYIVNKRDWHVEELPTALEPYLKPGRQLTVMEWDLALASDAPSRL